VEKAESWTDVGNAVTVSLALLGFALLLTWLGFVITTFLFYPFCSAPSGIGIASFRGSALFISAAFYVVWTWLKAQLPAESWQNKKWRRLTESFKASPSFCDQRSRLLLCRRALGTLVGVASGHRSGGGDLAPSSSYISHRPGILMIMLAGLYYGVMYGGSTTSILVNISARPPPWLPASMATRWPDGEEPASLGSRHGLFFAGTVGVIGLMFRRRCWHPSRLFGAPEYFSMVMSMTLVTYLCAARNSKR
jgi:hypothetical protein